MGQTLTSTEVIRRLLAAGFVLNRVKGSHHQFKKPGHNFTITVPHPKKELRVGLLKSIERASGVSMH